MTTQHSIVATQHDNNMVATAADCQDISVTNKKVNNWPIANAAYGVHFSHVNSTFQ